jgi:hypothetical protein
MTQELEALLLSVKLGDILFVDVDAVNVEALREYSAVHPDRVQCVIVPVLVPNGKKIQDCVTQFVKTQETPRV